MGSNLGGVARALASAFEVHQVDLPNHGRSGWCDALTLRRLADVVAAHLESRGLKRVRLLGHSLGGKVAMQLALDAPERVESLVVADIAPVAYAPSHAAVFAAIDAVAAAGPASRSDAAELLREHLSEEAVVQFLLLSLQRAEGGVYRWRFHARALHDSYSELLAAPTGGPCDRPALFLHGALSSYVTEAGIAAARRLFPRASFEAIEGTGHWLHAEKAQVFNAAVKDFFVTGGDAGAC
jgi:esterase